jgi:uncharacterized membrane protein YeaQ/YmgE (transglycosylase-associated protein family)
VTILDFILLLVAAGVVGSIGQASARYTRGGCPASIALGFVGASVGVWLERQMPLAPVFVAVVSLFARRWS